LANYSQTAKNDLGGEHLTTEEIIKRAFELGEAIANSEEIVQLKEMQERLTSDQQAYDLVVRYQDARNQINHKLEDGLLVTKEEESHLDIMEQRLNNNQLVQQLIQAQEKFDNLMQAVYFAMNQTVFGGDCSAGCDSCGGHCM
jgi:cell fate (sporulation/competence/biofilm development) regulator YlbF (YheA/YmcA/DUF963 family)